MAKAQGLYWPLPEDVEEARLEALLYPAALAQFAEHVRNLFELAPSGRL
nr:hypothetical protein [Halorhodospira halochloris]